MKVKFCLLLFTTMIISGCSGEKKQTKNDVENLFRIEAKITGTDRTNNMTIGLRTSKGCFFTDKLNNSSSEYNEEPENLTADIKKDTACFTTNGKYVILNASCGSSTFQGAAMRIKVYKNDKLVKQLTTTRLKPINTILYNSIEDRL